MMNLGVADPKRTPWVAYEGKGGNSAATWHIIRDQLLAFLERSVGTRDDFENTGWAIGTKGQEVRFWRYTAMNVGALKMIPLDIGPNGPRSPNRRAGQELRTSFDIIYGWGDVERLIGYTLMKAPRQEW